MKILVCFSGGKDSQACLIKTCRDYGPNNVEAVFCDTGWEHEFTYDHVHNVVRELGCRLTILKAKVGGFRDLCTRMKWFPDARSRMCTVQLKVRPMIDYILTFDDDLIIVQGIRAAESHERALMTCSGDYFAEYFEHRSRSRRLYKVLDVRRWCSGHRAYVERPMFGLSSQDVIDYILASGQQPNPLYRMGFSRVGCFPCIFAKLSDIKAMRKFDFYVKRVQELEGEVNKLRSKDTTSFRPASLLPVGKIPVRFCTEYGGDVPSFNDVIRYVSRDDLQLSLFDDEGNTSCMSMYHGLCE